MLTTSIVNKILHVPTVKMKEVAGRDQCYLYVDAVRTLFDLDAGEDGEEPAAGDGAAQPPAARSRTAASLPPCRRHRPSPARHRDGGRVNSHRRKATEGGLSRGAAEQHRAWSVERAQKGRRSET